MKKARLLDILVSRYPHESRKALHSYIMCGEVKVSSSIIRDPKHLISDNVSISITSKEYVSRGAYKLQSALEFWKIDVSGKCMLDAGASTGGFTDVLLQNGASMVYAVDVGYNQLDYSLRTDPRVVVMEKINIMDVKELVPAPDGAVADLSFRSLKGAAEKIIELTGEKWCISLIKPQFEIDNGYPGFNGVITDVDVLRTVLFDTVEKLEANKLKPVCLFPASIKGTKGNQEFLVLIDQNGIFRESKENNMIDNAISKIE